ncbi:MAG: prolyl aminopeptidase [Propionibacteriaceae bacterium]
MATNPLQPERELYPEIEPYISGLLDVGDGQQIYYEVSGNPEGKPAVFLHGGPGGGTSPTQRRFWNPEKYQIILFDQRGCGNSTPHASTPGIDMSTNTTWHLVEDMEKLRQYLGLERWQVFGGSWGSTLALAYAQKHPERVTELVLRGIFTLRRAELDWYYNGPGADFIHPDRWELYSEPLGDGFTGDRIARYNEILFGDDHEAAGRAGVAWTTWEGATTTLIVDEEQLAHYSVPEFALAFARIENHYFHHAGWLEEGQLIADAHKISHIPTVIVQGRYDTCCPVRTAWDLHRALPEADFRIVLAGHSAYEPMIASELVAATDRFATA